MKSHKPHGEIPQKVPADTNNPPLPKLAEYEFEATVEKIGANLLHRPDRMEIELRILTFLNHAVGPSTDGIAREMGIGVDLADAFLNLLHEANLIWGQAVHGQDLEWHISQEGRH